MEDLSTRFDADQRAVNEAVGELLRTWEGGSATNFEAKWSGGAVGISAVAVLADAKAQLDAFVRKLDDYADQLEHAQHDHWIQTALTAALTVANVAQLGLDPATDAAEVGLLSVGTMAFREGAIAGFSDLVGQGGADLWDRLDSGFDHTGDHAVGLLDPVELIVATASGAIGGVALAGTARAARSVWRRMSSASSDAIQSIDDVLANPNTLRATSPEDVGDAIGNSPGWKEESLGRGTHKGGGWALREYGPNGRPTGRLIRWHPGGGRHGPDPYWRVSSSLGGKSEIIPAAPSRTGAPSASGASSG